jgi:hypothetical protein
MTAARWWRPRQSNIARNFVRWPANWRFHLQHLNSFLKMHPEETLEAFAGFLCNLFDNWEGMPEEVTNLLEDRGFARAVIALDALNGLEEQTELQQQTWKYARRLMDYVNDGELYTYLFEEFIRNLTIALEAKAEQTKKEKKRRLELIRAELLEVAWNPHRFQLWCCDTEEQEMFRGIGWDGGYYQDPPTAPAKGAAVPLEVV